MSDCFYGGDSEAFYSPGPCKLDLCLFLNCFPEEGRKDVYTVVDPFGRSAIMETCCLGGSVSVTGQHMGQVPLEPLKAKFSLFTLT